MWSLFRKTLSMKTVFRNDLRYNILGMNLKDNVIIGYRFNILLNSYSRSLSMPQIIGSQPKEWSGANDISEEDKKSNENSLFCCDAEFPGTSEGDNKINNVLKEENLNLFKEIANGDNSLFELLRYLQVRLDVTSCKYGIKVNMKKKDWLEFLENTATKRKTFVAFLIIDTMKMIQKKIEKASLHKLPDAGEDEDIMSQYYDDVRCYHLFHNSMFLKLRYSAIKKSNYAKSFTAMLYSPCLIFDCSYDNFMSHNETRDLGRQLIASTGLNIRSENPFHIIFCNLNKDSKVARHLKSNNPIFFDDEFPVTVTEKSYLDMYDKSSLVYLTPHCRKTLKALEPEKVYIIGAYVDKSNKRPVSMAKAKEQGIEMAKFPIDIYLDWAMGSKCLNLPHVMQILLDLRTYNGDWNKAFEVIPRRCLDKNRVRTSKVSRGFMVKKMYEDVLSDLK